MYETLFFDISADLEQSEREPGAGPLQGRWADKHWMNTPGPLYSANSTNDNGNAGPLVAPNNVVLDGKGFQVIYRQPANPYEFWQVVEAACNDTVYAYGADGNQHWTYVRIKEWWAAPRQEIEQEVERLFDAQIGLGIQKDHVQFHSLLRWRDYLEYELQRYLQVYAFFLDNEHIPTERDTLPEL